MPCGRAARSRRSRSSAPSRGRSRTSDRKPSTLIERARGDVANLDFEKANNALRQSRAESEKSIQRSLEGKIADFRSEALDPDRAGARGRGEPRLREGEQCPAAEPRGVGEVDPALPRGEDRGLQIGSPRP